MAALTSPHLPLIAQRETTGIEFSKALDVFRRDSVIAAHRMVERVKLLSRRGDDEDRHSPKVLASNLDGPRNESCPAIVQLDPMVHDNLWWRALARLEKAWDIQLDCMVWAHRKWCGRYADEQG